MACLEIIMPTNWNTQTRAMLVGRFTTQLRRFGSFWATNMLSIEAFHTLVKALGRSRKNLLASFLSNYSLFDVASLDWDFDDDLDLEGATSPSVLSRCKPRVDDDDDVSLVERQALHHLVLGEATYLCIIEIHAALDDNAASFETVLRKYLAAMRRPGAVFAPLDQWVTSKNRAVLERQLDYTERQALHLDKLMPFALVTKRIDRANFGDAFFCTPTYQEKFSNNNQWIMVEQPVSPGRTAFYYGHIRRMYYVRLRADDKPTFVVQCYWYDVHKQKGTNGLTQLKFAARFGNGQFGENDLQFLDVCVPENFVVWPTDPFNFNFNDSAQWRNTNLTFDVIRPGS
jgi:hypothetical protein